MASLKHAKVAIGDDNPDRQVSVTHWNAEHTLTGTANYLVGYDGAGSATDVNPATLVVGAATQQVATRTALAALSTSAPAAYLRESGREGMFVWSSSNNATNVTNDPGQAIYVPPASDSTGASGAWVRRYSGAKSAKWFGATGDGTTDDTTALQRWLDSGGNLVLPVAEYYSSAKLIVRKNVTIDGQGYGFDARIVDGSSTLGYDNQPGSRIRFNTAVGGLDFQPQTTVTDVATAVAAGLGGDTQEGSAYSVVRNLALIGAGTGAAAVGVYARTVVHLDNVHVIKFQGKGFDLSASGATADGNSEYGNLNGSTLRNCRAASNGSHGFHIRGNDANNCTIFNCVAINNAGWGFLDESLLGNNYVGGDAATNTSGSFKCIGAVANSDYIGCYAEVGTGQAPDLSYRCVVTGGYLADIAKQYNVGTLGQPTIHGSDGLATYKQTIHYSVDEATAVPASSGLIYRGATRGLTLGGRGSGYDVTLINSSNQAVMGIVAGTKTSQHFGEVQIVQNGLFFNDVSTWAGAFGGNGNARGFATATGGLQLYGQGSSYDVSIGNRVGTIALRVPTGTSNVEAVGTITGSNLSGTNTGDQYTSLTGLSVVGRSANTSGAAAAITAVTDGHVLRLSGTTLGFGTVAAAAMPALTGDVTTSAGAVATTLATNIVTYAKFQQVAASSLVGNATGSLANATGITLAGGLAFSGSTLTAAGALTPTSVASTGAVTSSSASAGIGYATGAGGTASQATSKSTTVSGTNKRCVDITLNGAALAASTTVSFTFTNTAIVATDNFIINHISVGTFGSYTFNGRAAAGSATIDVRNVSLGSLSEAIVIRVTAISGATS